MGRYFLGIMSGTSLDGVDIALCHSKGDSFELVCAKTYPFELKDEVLKAIENRLNIKEFGELDIKLGELFANKTLELIDEFGIKNVEAIGLHGQTLWHEPPLFSMQLGSPWSLRVKTGIKVVADFRQKDVALGGEGAPLTPAFHEFMFKGENTAVLNIGGMANITILGKMGYDTGCGNVLLDMWIKEHKNLPYDKDGLWARSGRVDDKLLEALLDEAYFKKPSPKSTGRELFNKTWLGKKLKGFKGLKPEDIQATLLELSAKTISDEAKKHGIKKLIVCGGGAKNLYLLERLDIDEVITSDEAGVSSEFMEAMAFAWLAKERIDSRAINIKHITGAKQNTTLGAIYD